MIFSNRNYKISNGTNVSLFANKENEMIFYIFNNSISKNIITISNTLKLTNLNQNYPYNYISKITNNLLCVCFDDNMSVINETN